jgi:hypothetical protein
MARDAVSVTALTLNDGVAMGAGVTIDPANDAVINCDGDTRGLFVRITNTNGSDRVATFVAGDNPPALGAGLGNHDETVAATSGDMIFALEGSRFLQNDGTILVDFAASFAGKIWAFRVPKTA